MSWTSSFGSNTQALTHSHCDSRSQAGWWTFSCPCCYCVANRAANSACGGSPIGSYSLACSFQPSSDWWACCLCTCWSWRESTRLFWMRSSWPERDRSSRYYYGWCCGLLCLCCWLGSSSNCAELFETWGFSWLRWWCSAWCSWCSWPWDCLLRFLSRLSWLAVSLCCVSCFLCWRPGCWCCFQRLSRSRCWGFHWKWTVPYFIKEPIFNWVIDKTFLLSKLLLDTFWIGLLNRLGNRSR